jgi:hypothetical protein
MASLRYVYEIADTSLHVKQGETHQEGHTYDT